MRRSRPVLTPLRKEAHIPPHQGKESLGHLRNLSVWTSWDQALRAGVGGWGFAEAKGFEPLPPRVRPGGKGCPLGSRWDLQKLCEGVGSFGIPEPSTVLHKAHCPDRLTKTKPPELMGGWLSGGQGPTFSGAAHGRSEGTGVLQEAVEGNKPQVDSGGLWPESLHLSPPSLRGLTN